MTVFLTILKVIGWILLVILLLLILALLLILFVPVRYQAKVSSHERVCAKVRVTWLLHLIRFSLDYSEEGMYSAAHVLCFPISLSGARKEAGEKMNTEADIEEMSESKVNLESDNDSQNPEELSDTGTAEPDNEVDLAAIRNKKPGIWQKIITTLKNVKKRIRSMIDSFVGMLRNIRQTLEKIKNLMGDQRNKDAFSFLKNELFYILKKCMPKKMKVTAAYSTGSPDTTGEVLGILAMFPVGYRNRWNIAPDFTADHFYVDGEAFIKGRISIYQMIGAFVRILRDKNCRRLMAKIKA